MVNTSGKGVRDPGFKSLISQNFFFFAIKNVYTDDKVLHMQDHPFCKARLINLFFTLDYDILMKELCNI